MTCSPSMEGQRAFSRLVLSFYTNRPTSEKKKERMDTNETPVNMQSGAQNLFNKTIVCIN